MPPTVGVSELRVRSSVHCGTAGLEKDLGVLGCFHETDLGRGGVSPLLSVVLNVDQVRCP